MRCPSHNIDREDQTREKVALLLPVETAEKLRSLGPNWSEHVNRILRQAFDEDSDLELGSRDT